MQADVAVGVYSRDPTVVRTMMAGVNCHYQTSVLHWPPRRLILHMEIQPPANVDRVLDDDGLATRAFQNGEAPHHLLSSSTSSATCSDVDPAACDKSPYDVFIHVGVSPSRPHISLEKRARRYGYERKDAEGVYAPSSIDPKSGRLVRGFGDPWWCQVHDDGTTTSERGVRQHSPIGELDRQDALETSLDVQTMATAITEIKLAQVQVSLDPGES